MKYTNVVHIKLFFILMALSCSNFSNSSSFNNDNDSGCTKKIKKAILASGIYGETSIAIDSFNNLTGVYEYYDAWDEKYKDYTQTCVFYFSGRVVQDSLVYIKGGWPHGDQILKGYIKVDTNSIKIVLNDIPDGYAAVDFKDENGYQRKLDHKENWREIRIVKAPKARLYEHPDSVSIKRAYIIEGDIVKVAEMNGNWCKIEYKAITSSRSIIAWMRNEDLYNINPDKW